MIAVPSDLDLVDEEYKRDGGETFRLISSVPSTGSASNLAKVLVVDDNMFSGMALKTILKQYDLESDVATDGKEAAAYVRERYERHGDTYDLVFMDQAMPICDGIKSTELIRAYLEGETGASEQKPYICLMTTSYDKSLHTIDGINECFNKPIYKNGVEKILAKANLLTQ